MNIKQLWRDIKRQWHFDPPSFYVLPHWTRILAQRNATNFHPHVVKASSDYEPATVTHWKMILTFFPSLYALWKEERKTTYPRWPA